MEARSETIQKYISENIHNSPFIEDRFEQIAMDHVSRLRLKLDEAAGGDTVTDITDDGLYDIICPQLENVYDPEAYGVRD